MEAKFVPQFNGRQRQAIGAARQGVHPTIYGEIEVLHHGDKTYCRPYAPNGVALVSRALTGEGHEGPRPYLSLAERQRLAMQEFAPRPFPHASKLSDDEVIWRNGVGFPRGFAREMVGATLAAGLSVPAEISSAVLKPVDSGAPN